MKLCDTHLNNAEYMSEHEFLYVIGVLYQGGVHVSVAALRHFPDTFQLHPSVVDTAQHELDSVLGPTNSMPSLDDLARLPYTSILVPQHSMASFIPRD